MPGGKIAQLKVNTLNDKPLTNKNINNNKITQEDLLEFNEKYKKKYLELNER